MSAQDLQNLIGATRGKWFRVTFVKKTTGEPRLMVARVGVVRHLKGGSLPYKPEDRQNVIVWDATVRGYRTIPLENLTSFKCGTVSWEKGQVR